MENGHVILDRLYEQNHNTDGLFFRITCDRDTALQNMMVKGITMSESFDLMIPTMIIDFIDGSGDLLNHNRLDTDAIYTLSIGRTMTDTVETRYKISDIVAGNGIGGRNINSNFRVVFSHAHWDIFGGKRKNRAWNNSYISDVIRDIVSEYGFNKVSIENSLNRSEVIIQPDITDNDFIMSLKRRSTPESRDGHYETCVTLKNEFIFKSTFSLIQDGINKYRSDSLPLLRLGGILPPSERNRAYKNNEKVPISFMGFNTEEHYMRSITDGANMIKHSYFDWNNREYITSTDTISDLNATQLSDWSLIRDDAKFVSKEAFGGRAEDVSIVARNALSEKSLRMQEISINMVGQLELHCGDIVEILIPTGDDSQIPYSELYSGFYMIKEANHRLFLRESLDYTTSLVLVRHGMDGKTLSGYSKSIRGKANF